MVGLNDLQVFSNLGDSVILWFLCIIVATQAQVANYQ